jgi:hypothetical protein
MADKQNKTRWTSGFKRQPARTTIEQTMARAGNQWQPS